MVPLRDDEILLSWCAYYIYSIFEFSKVVTTTRVSIQASCSPQTADVFQQTSGMLKSTKMELFLDAIYTHEPVADDAAAFTK